MKKTVSLLFLPLMICPMFLLITCSAKNVPTGNIVLANYESYINPDIEEAYGSEISFLYFSTDDDIMNKFQGNYDMAIPSFNTIVTLIKKGWLSQVDWEMFGLKYCDSSNNLKTIKSGKDVLKYLITSKTVNENNSDIDLVFEAADKWLSSDTGKKFLPQSYLSTHNDDQISILDWTVPYFFSSLTFSYWNTGERKIEEDSWSNILEYINGTKINAPYEKFSLIDDYRTVYDMAKLYQNELNNETVRGIEVPSNIVSEKTFIDTYQKFAKKSTGKYVLNTDSNELAASFIDRGSGILCYNGDNIYGAIGLGQVDYQNQLIKGWYENDVNDDSLLYGCVPSENVFILDGIVFNKALEDDVGRKEKAYSLIANIALDHVDYEQYLAYQDANNISDDDFIYGEEALPIYEVDDDGNYMFYPFSNFDYLCYTSPWSAIDTYVSDSEGGYFYDLLLWLIYEESGNGWIDEDGTYHLNQELIDLYDDQTAVTNGYIPQNWVDYLKLVYSINYPFTGLDQSGEVDLSKGIYMELPLNDLQKSNMHWAYEKSKHLF